MYRVEIHRHICCLILDSNIWMFQVPKYQLMFLVVYSDHQMTFQLEPQRFARIMMAYYWAIELVEQMVSPRVVRMASQMVERMVK